MICPVASLQKRITVLNAVQFLAGAVAWFPTPGCAGKVVCAAWEAS
ncbi:hypothetical protein HNQ93_002613 [Hymenobacter luteus]|uniref:Uncharacterized protein n=2 Tax=Hymenobacter TaxID=89966 RepID=A0A7W9WC69_9BACT|nr:hypothetical protein [Hymenobacter latericoloratus]MBB6059753.1 hypothetical protein [Hymenobacter luteus]